MSKAAKRKHKTLQMRVIEPRNPLFNHPLMKRSHAHVKSNKAKRRAEKVKGRQDWYSQNGFIKTFLKISIQPNKLKLGF